MTPAFLPNRHQELLLEACLFERDRAIGAWREWRAQVDLDTIDRGSVRLLSLLAARLGEAGVDDSQFGKYRGVQRRTWARNTLLFRHVGALVTQFGDAGIAALVLKGAAVAGRYYPAMSMRPMGDVDLMVRPEEALRAHDLLEAAGWRCSHRPPRDRADRAIWHAVTYVHPRSPEVAIDLHWRLLPTRFSDEAEADLWRWAVPISLDGAAAQAPSAADLLLHTCAHGACFNGLPPVRWIVDAAMIVRSGEVDWQHLLVQSARYRLGLPLGIALGYLAEAMEIAVPPTVLEALGREARLPIDRTLFALDQVPLDRRRFASQLRMHLHVARRALGGSPLDYWRYFNRLRGDRSLGQTLRWIADRAVRGHRASRGHQT